MNSIKTTKSIFLHLKNKSNERNKSMKVDNEYCYERVFVNIRNSQNEYISGYSICKEYSRSKIYAFINFFSENNRTLTKAYKTKKAFESALKRIALKIKDKNFSIK